MRTAIDTGELPAERPGTRRKVRLRDVLEYRERRRRQQCDMLAATAIDIDDEDDPAEVASRLRKVQAARQTTATVNRPKFDRAPQGERQYRDGHARRHRYPRGDSRWRDMVGLPRESSEESMSAMGRYRKRIDATIERASAYMREGRLALAIEMASHGEPAEAMVSLAWAIVDEGVKVPAVVISEIEVLSAGWIPEGTLPDTLHDHVLPD
ncbi:hypothetical protein [Cellulomonas denverensis]|uniref:hypothetical protein n=1 Tax=Cellulomonas denverensis TaxID=264297 RepID=UPI0035ED1E3D